MGLIIAVAAAGLWLQGARGPAVAIIVPAEGSSRVWSRYLPLLVVNVALTGYCCRLFWVRHVLGTLIGQTARSISRAGLDLAWAVALVVLIQCAEFAFATLLGVRRDAALSALLPNTLFERVSWVVVAVSVGFCEEIVYRGYLQTQLSALTGRASLGITLQAALFGLSHAEQGLAAGLRIALYGVAFGLVAKGRGNLMPGILAHIAIDLGSAFVNA